MIQRGMSSGSKRMKEIHRVRVWNKKGVESSTGKLPPILIYSFGYIMPGGLRAVLSCLLTLYTPVLKSVSVLTLGENPPPFVG